PSNGIFTIQSDEQISEITVFDLPGKQIYESSYAGKSGTVDLSAQPDGIYFLKIKTADGITIRKIIKQ
ncbi:MAG TPA: T9SS type A sorting domain-containing protein, partial [Bacteroidia bacterium]|nr:T9SS type A sorting domain-containing protein [Bacteroidia bacterium]